MKAYYADGPATLFHGDCIEVMRSLPDASVDAVVTDPPYGLEFMGREWDGADGFRRSLNAADAGRDSVFGRTSAKAPEYKTTSKAAAGMSGTGYTDGANRIERPSHLGGLNPKCQKCDRWQRGGNPCRCESPEFTNERLPRLQTFQAWCEAWAAEALRVLKPGGHLLTFGGSRTWHRLAAGIEDAGFEIRDSIAWLYGSGFSKSWNFDTRFDGEWCSCLTEKSIPYSHAGDSDVFGVRDGVFSSAVARGEGDDADLLPAVQREAARSGVEDARSQRPRSLDERVGAGVPGAHARREESGLEGRLVHRTGEGLSDDPTTGSPASSGERVRGGAPARDGVDDRSPGGATRGSTPRQPGSGGQPAGESSAVPGPHVALDDGALRGRADCPRCGGLREEYRGFGTALKPAFEPIVVARKPLIGTVAQNVLAHGTGALNIAACRVEGEFTSGWSKSGSKASENNSMSGPNYARDPKPDNPAGRWPTNVVLDESQADELDRQSGESVSRVGSPRGAAAGDGWGMTATGAEYNDSGGASRFFPTFRYEAKAPTSERPNVDGLAHPTVKPLDLMRWLVRLVTPPNGTVLEPFAGSGTTLEAALAEGFNVIGIEREADYLPLIMSRLQKPIEQTLFGGDAA